MDKEMDQDTIFAENLTAYIDHIKADYMRWQGKVGKHNEIVEEMIRDYVDSVHVEQGSKYIKVITQKSVHSFIVVKPDAKFKFGDILKAASWASPARNFNRGNIMDKVFGNATWTGVH